MAFVLIPHLDPAHASMMPDLLKRFTRMRVLEAEDGMIILPNHAYVIPPNKDMAIYHGNLQLTVPQKARGLRMPIDFFLRSLAEDQGDKAICIILSGTGSDGSMGLRAIHGAGGITMVQEAETASYEGMPRSALNTGLVDFVLPVGKMPEQLLAYVKKISAKKPTAISTSDKSPTALQKVLLILRSQTGNDFSYYKKSTIYRRVEKRLDVHNIEDLPHYARFLQEHPEEVQSLFKELLIGVTSFFRDPEAFEILKKKVLPLLLKDKPEGYQLRIWVPGCSSGEEAYSLAMICLEYIESENRDIRLQVFGTDIDEEAINLARAGFYLDNIAIDVSPDRIRHFFFKEEGGFRIKKDLRETIVFAVQNVVKDAPFTKLDLVSCRNLLIYLEPELQNRLLPLFHYSLKPGAILFLGTAESITKFADLYSVLEKKWKIFQTKGATVTQAEVLTGPWSYETAPRQGGAETKRAQRSSIDEMTKRILMETFVPPSVITNEKGEILYIYGQTGKYLEPPQGQPSMNILDMAREGLRVELRSALHGAITKKKEMRYSSLKVRINDEYQTLNLRVKPLAGPEQEGMFLAVFEDASPIPEPKASAARVKQADERELRVREIEQELNFTKENLRATIEELQAANEELRSTNEEFQSTNEELQSTNEELETSKEELQSVNEELVTVNSELQAKIEQQSRTENDMKALLDSINIGTLFLNTEFRIKRFTSTAAKVFNLIPTDIGRSIGDIRSNLRYDEILADAQRVIETLAPLEREIEARDSSWYLMRITPSRTEENIVDGVVATFTNITPLRVSKNELIQSGQRLADVLESACDGLFILDPQGRFVYLNDGAEKYFAVSRQELMGKSIWNLASKSDNLSKQLKLAMDKSTTAEFEDFAPGMNSRMIFRVFPCQGGLSVFLHELERPGKKT